MAYPDCLLIKAPTLSFGRTFAVGGGIVSNTKIHLQQLCAASRVRAVYNDMISNEGTRGEKAELAAVMEKCKVGTYDGYGGADKWRSEWNFWF